MQLPPYYYGAERGAEMFTIAILPEQSKDQPTTFSAITTGRQATGRTAGEALDALTSQLSTEETVDEVTKGAVRLFDPRHDA